MNVYVATLKVYQININNILFVHIWFIVNENKQKSSLSKSISLALTSGLRRDVDEICGLLGNYTASCGNYLPIFK
jgi:hypothetical protein